MGSLMSGFTMNTLGWTVTGTGASVAGARIQNQQPPESGFAMVAAVLEAKKNVEAIRDATWLSLYSINFGSSPSRAGTAPALEFCGAQENGSARLQEED
jgi:hypothetical protein